MSTENKNGYLLLFRGKEWWNGVSPEELQRMMDRVKDWFDGLAASGKLKMAQPLAREGALVSGKNGRILADGPFAESKEVIGGYVLLDVDRLDEAIVIAQSCPTLEFDTQVEVRPVAEECPMTARARQIMPEEQLATAAA